MSTKLIGLGAFAAGCLTAASAAYVSLRQPEPAVLAPVAAAVEAPVETAVVPAATEDSQPAPTPTRTPAEQPAPPPPVRRPATSVPPPVPSSAPATPPVATPAEVPVPASSLPPPPATEPPVVPPPVVEPPRYVPDPQLTPTTVPQPEAWTEFEELTVERHSVIGIRLNTAVSSRTARVEDRISATVSRDVTVQGRVAVPEGVRLEGTITAVERGGRFRDRPRLGLRFDTMILLDGTRLTISTDTIYREGDSPSADATAKVGAGAAAGAILGAVLGGKKGAILGGAAGVAGGVAAVRAGEDNETALRAGAPLTVRLTDDLTIQVKKQ